LITGRAWSIEKVTEALAGGLPVVVVAVILHLPTDLIVTTPVEALIVQPPLAAYLTGLPSAEVADALKGGSPQRLSGICFRVTPPDGVVL
jgi:hypothetical protein